MDRVQKKVKYDNPSGREHQNLYDNYNDEDQYPNSNVEVIFFCLIFTNIIFQIEEDAPPQKFEADDLKKLIKNFEKHILKNQELRSKYPKNPEK